MNSLNSIQDFISLAKEIGKRGNVKEDEVLKILVNYPKLFGSEFIFQIGHANAHRFIDDEVEDLVKGLHLIELKFVEMRDGKNNLNEQIFGFGSPSPTYKIIEALSKMNLDKAEKLKKWIAERSGNYYIKILKYKNNI